MSLTAAIGQSFALNGREASTQAIAQALNQIELPSISLALIFASHDFDIHEVLGGAAAKLGNIPLLGFSTSGEITAQGNSRRSVVVALLAGDDLDSRADWFPGFSLASF